MREAIFIRQNLKKWKEYEALIDYASQESPDKLADVYTDLTSDLAFAQTHYPNSKATQYLNGLSLMLHNELYKERRESWSRFKDFWVRDIPLAMYDARKEMRASLILFLVCVGIGVVSTVYDVDFPRLILGDYYVDMTIENIQNGTPTAVYNDSNSDYMFVSIWLNNFRVGLMTFTIGVFTSIATGYYIIYNAIMFGAFMTFFAQYGVLGPSAMAVMQHGTLELSTIVLEGGAGILMGNAWLYPGTYSRIESFKRGAQHALKIAVSVMPVTLVAAILESYVTRHVEAPFVLRAAVILFSAAFIIYYYVVLPVKVHRMVNKPVADERKEIA